MNKNQLKASTIIGHNILNDQGKQIGTIKDLIIFQKDGTVLALISSGFNFGESKKYHVVPLAAFGFALQEKTMKDELIITLDISKNELKNAPGFDTDNWKQALDSKFVQSVYDFFELENPQLSSSQNRI
ncbi:PRC-barrel domain containing protein [Rhodohalobacter sp. SW132]|uniref:PRC-barrel domain-containing protein n=1 Tax=Rhodohalobacter sp. SW132 TaxID=2293433 RepID=UPI000E24D8A8|nr:PRC-barrel domain-containing protein [Rhodohalobacter sp. SW132]REL32940.1 PRC-barrel domain containing protein [Rhodohalobacter sp. SW132]